MNQLVASIVPLGEISRRTGNEGIDFEAAGANLLIFFHWLGSLSATGWLLIAAAIAVAIYYWWCLGPFDWHCESDFSDYDYYD